MKHFLTRIATTCFSLVLFNVTQAQDLRFTSALQTTNGVWLQWSNSAPGQAYTLQGRDRMTNSIWLTLDSPQPWPTVQTQWNATISPAQLMHFYRVAAVQPAMRGTLLSATLWTNFSAPLLNLFYYFYGITNLTAQYGVDCYKVVYETIDPLGGRTTASGGLYLPEHSGVNWPLLSFSRGTVTQTNDVPSEAVTLDAFAGIAFASVGYASVVADLLGLGSSPGLHPYLHARSEATASVDMLRAARNFCTSNNIGLNGQLFLAGYSQGGHTVMALDRDLERYYTNEFTVTACAPMAGPYDLSGVELNDMLSSRCPPNPYYAAYVLVAYQSVYSLAPHWSDLLAPPYDTTIPPLFNGNTGSSTINSALPPCNISSILVPTVRAALTNDPGSPLYQALRDNDVDHWKPVAPMRLFHCSGDQDVLPANSQVALSNFVAQGASEVSLVDPMPGADHSGCVLPALTAAKTWFDTFKQ